MKSRIKSFKNKSKKTKIMSLIIIIIAVILLSFIYILFFKSNSKNVGRCPVDYKISDSTSSKVKAKIKEIQNVDDVDIYLNVCIVKIIINLSDDVDVDIIKSKMTESLQEFDKELLENYDVELFIKSKNKESDKYPIIVSKHKSEKDFYWE